MRLFAKTEYSADEIYCNWQGRQNYSDTDYIKYSQQFDMLKDQFDSLDEAQWNRNLYWGWLFCLKTLLEEYGQGYPSFMQTQAWSKKQLNAALASWTELRHDTILYAKQSYTPEIGTAPPPPPPPPPGYVEPVPQFYGSLLMLTDMTVRGLTDLNVLDRASLTRLLRLEIMLVKLTLIANKQLLNYELSQADHEYIRNFPSVLEGIVTGVDDSGVKTTLVADVHTYGGQGKVLEEAVGYVDLIVVACPGPEGSAFLAIGPTLSYYEFKHPMNDRLTDDAWTRLLESENKPQRPTWIEPLMPRSLPPD